MKQTYVTIEMKKCLSL